MFTIKKRILHEQEKSKSNGKSKRNNLTFTEDQYILGSRLYVKVGMVLRGGLGWALTVTFGNSVAAWQVIVIASRAR